MARAARLKVFLTPAGFDDVLVAAPSRRAALQAWGARGDLFALGEACEVDDPELTALALARPGEVVRRPRGDMAALLAAAPKPRPGVKAAAPAPPTPPDRSALDAAEGALAAAQAELDGELAAIMEERARLDRREAEARRAGRTRLAALERTRAAAARRYDAAVQSNGG